MEFIEQIKNRKSRINYSYKAPVSLYSPGGIDRKNLPSYFPLLFILKPQIEFYIILKCVATANHESRKPGYPKAI